MNTDPVKAGQKPDAESNSKQELRSRISRADLIYHEPVKRSEEGMPLGNGRMGTLVWSTPEQIRLQINRVDVYANNSYTNSFVERHNDYCGGCAYVDIDFGSRETDTFIPPFVPPTPFRLRRHNNAYREANISRDDCLAGSGRYRRADHRCTAKTRHLCR